MIKIRAFAPTTFMKSEAFRSKIENLMKTESGPQVKNLFEKTIEGWENAPYFTSMFTRRVSYLSIRIQASGNNSHIYSYVNYGTDPHPIKAKNYPTLKFQTGYTPATRPRLLASRKPKRFGPWATPKAVNHPGIEARRFDEEIKEQYEPIFQEDVQQVINEVAEAEMARANRESSAMLNSS